ncbi:MAG: hypothetical protein ACYC7J_07650 [Syntrophales bacterium]
MKIAIITDGNNTLGMGHVYQSVTLAGELSPKMDPQSTVFFITKSDRTVLDRLTETGLRACQYPDDDAILDALVGEAPDRVIFDKLDVSPLLAEQIKRMVECRLIILTNLTAANRYADVTVLADIGSNFKNIVRKNKKTGAVHFWGPRYWILRPEFFGYAGRKKNPPERVKRIMLMFGGADHANITSAALKELLCMSSSFEIMVVAGPAFLHQAELQAVIEQHSGTQSAVQVVHNLTDVAAAMHASDVVFASPGLSFFEALTVGTPVVGFHQDTLQRDVYKGYLTTVDKSDVTRIPAIIESKDFIFPDDSFVASMEIGQGKDEIVQAIL